MILDTETINTAAGRYVLDWIQDDNADAPYDEGFTLLKNGSAWGPYSRINIQEGDTDSPVAATILQALSNHAHGWDQISGAAIVRYLRLAGKRGVTLVDHEYSPVEPSTDRSERVYGVAWAPDDAADWHMPEQAFHYTYCALAQWRAWADGDVFGWRLTDPAGDEVESVWGYYGSAFDTQPGSERNHTLEEATDAAQADAERRLSQANLAGAGLIGLI